MHKKIYAEFAKYGFIACPLSPRMIQHCIHAGFTIDQIYSIGCDVYAGWSFRESIDAVIDKQ